MKNGSIETDFTVKTSGGLWSKKVTNVKVSRLDWNTSEPDGDLGPETFVEVYFEPSTWRVKRDGLLYTDKSFETGLKEQVLELVKQGKLPAELPWNDISYTEQGMQHEHYVHMILGSW